MYIPQPCAQMAHRHYATDIYPSIVGSKYPIQMYKCIYYKMYIPQPCAQRAHRHPPTDINPPIVGSIYPPQMYIL